ncbi:MAG: ribosomal protein S18-alanine N-acetyltransferase [Rickettsiales bacterium]|nr:ribosomal protein S18-alanine N-acetyltransferase [Rickettsiales bacterium]
MTQIKPALVDSCQILSQLHQDCFPRGWGIAEFESFYLQDNVIAYLAYNATTPIGFIFSWVVAGHCELLSIAVAKEHRKQGIAEQLLQTLMDQLTEHNIPKIYLEVGHTNLAAQALYSKFGFDTRGIRKRYYKREDGSLEDALTMQLVL